MKVQCDVCAAEAASVFCCADEAALCTSCDHRVHSANKLASKHQRFSLHASSGQAPPLCDICQEKRGFLFCKEDRAILCRDCDLAVHSTNELTRNHQRFLLTGVRLSASPLESSAEAVDSLCDSSMKANRIISDGTDIATNSSTHTQTHSHSHSHSSSISDYLLNMLPGWHVEDLLIDDTATTSVTGDMDAFCKTEEEEEVAHYINGGDQKRTRLEPLQVKCWFPHSGGVGVTKQHRRSEELVRVPQPPEWVSQKRSKVSVRYL